MRDRVRIRIEGYNLERLLNRIAEERIAVFDVEKEKSAVEMNVYRADTSTLIDLCTGLCYNVINKGPVGQYKYRRIAFKNLFVIAGILLTFVYCLYCGTRLSGIILLDGAGVTNQDEVIAILEKMSIKNGTVLSDVDVDEVENRLSREIENSEYVIVTVRGSIMTVRVTARSQKPPAVDTQPRDIFALCDGVVTRVVAVNGTARVKAGDTVKKGQLLIEGIVEYADGSSERVYAQGRVYARVCEIAEVVFVEEKEGFELTGKSYTVTEFDVFGFRVKSVYENPFELFDEEYEKTVFAPAPVVMYRITYFEKVRVTYKVSFEEEKSLLIEKAKALAENKADFDTEDFAVEVKEGTTVTVRVTVYGTKVIS